MALLVWLCATEVRYMWIFHFPAKMQAKKPALPLNPTQHYTIKIKPSLSPLPSSWPSPSRLPTLSHHQGPSWRVPAGGVGFLAQIWKGRNCMCQDYQYTEAVGARLANLACLRLVSSLCFRDPYPPCNSVLRTFAFLGKINIYLTSKPELGLIHIDMGEVPNEDPLAEPGPIIVQKAIRLNDEEQKIFSFLKEMLAHFGMTTVMRVAGGWVRDKVRLSALL